MEERDMEEKIREAKRRYAAEHRAKNRQNIREYCRKWRKNNPEKVKAAQDRFWAKKAAEYAAAEQKQE